MSLPNLAALPLTMGGPLAGKKQNSNLVTKARAEGTRSQGITVPIAMNGIPGGLQNVELSDDYFRNQAVASIRRAIDNKVTGSIIEGALVATVQEQLENLYDSAYQARNDIGVIRNLVTEAKKLMVDPGNLGKMDDWLLALSGNGAAFARLHGSGSNQPMNSDDEYDVIDDMSEDEEPNSGSKDRNEYAPDDQPNFGIKDQMRPENEYAPDDQPNFGSKDQMRPENEPAPDAPDWYERERDLLVGDDEPAPDAPDWYQRERDLLVGDDDLPAVPNWRNGYAMPRGGSTHP